MHLIAPVKPTHTVIRLMEEVGIKICIPVYIKYNTESDKVVGLTDLWHRSDFYCKMVFMQEMLQSTLFYIWACIHFPYLYVANSMLQVLSYEYNL